MVLVRPPPTGNAVNDVSSRKPRYLAPTGQENRSRRCPTGRNVHIWHALLCSLLFLIAFSIFAHGADETLIRLTSDGHFKQRPCWSPDGRQVIFARHRGTTIFLYLRDVRTGEEERLTSHMSPEYDAVFSPDGKELLFSFDKTSPNQGDFDVYRVALSDRKHTPLATSQGILSHEESPCWSPDGKQFAFTSTRHGNQELYVADIAGGEWNRLTNDAAIDAHPAWSPDGKTIAFATNRWGDLEIALVDPDGSNLRRLTDSRGLDDYPAWSPDGRHVAFTSRRDGNDEIFVQPLDGPARNVTNDPGIDSFPTWTADGRIGFVSNRDGGFEIYLLDWGK